MKNVVVITSSLRKMSSSKELTLEVVKGLKNNNKVDIIDLSQLNFSFCEGCLACQKTGKCFKKDDVNNYLDLVSNADILLFATPIYYYSISGQLKTFLDRLNPLYIRKNHFKEIYALFTCADNNIKAIEGPKKAIQGWIDCFDEVEFIDSFIGLGINNVKDITPDLKLKAIEFGNKIK